MMFSRAIVIVVAMDKEVLRWHCIFSFAVSSCYQVHRSKPKMVQKIGTDFLVSQVLKSPEFLS